ncbi:hypothetical protein JCM8547_001346 [Rhodosporidiobolus lusitaniae]
MSGSDSLALVTARTLATAGLGFGVGITASIPLWTLPTIYSKESRTTPVDRLRLWSQLYDNGKHTMLRLLPVLISVLSYSAYSAKNPISYLPSNWWGNNRKVILAVSAVSTFGVGLWTGARMEKLNQYLKSIEAKINADVDVTTSSSSSSSPAKVSSVYAAQADEADKLIAGEWTWKHNVRVALFTVAFGLSLGELAFA